MEAPRNSPTSVAAASRPMGVYVHFPWCLRKCPYCDFVSYRAEPSDVPHEAYADAVLRELELRSESLRGTRLETVFFGGGTPSLWTADALGRVLAGVRGAFEHHADDVEVTVECNPTSLTEDHARALVDHGVNRLSVGVQSLDADRLAFLGRLHDEEGGLAAVRAAIRAGVPRVSGDLIFGVAGGRAQSSEDAGREAERVAQTGVSHVSAYGLTIEPATRFGELARAGKLPIATDDAMADAFFAVEAALERCDLKHYEVSNYARPGAEARHNLGYWRGDLYLGLGCGAYGTVRGEATPAVRYRNETRPHVYLATLAAGALAEVEAEPLDAETLLRERIMLGLRLEEGIDLEAHARDLNIDAAWRARASIVDRLVSKGRLERKGSRVRVPRRARALTDGIAAELF